MDSDYVEATRMIQHPYYQQDVTKFQDLRGRKLRLQYELDFLVRCRNLNIFPRFIMQNSPCVFKNYYMKKCVIRNRRALLRAAIHETRSKSAKLDEKLYKLHYNLHTAAHPIIWDIIDVKTLAIATKEASHKATILKNKLNRLCSEQIEPQGVKPAVLTQNIIENKSSVQLSESQTSILRLGLGHALPPRESAIEDLLCHLDHGINKGTETENKAALVKASIRTIIDKSEAPQKSTFPFKAAKELANEDVVIIKADKGNRIVVVDKVDYETGVAELLKDADTYTELKKDPTDHLVKELKEVIHSCPSISPIQQGKLVPSVHILPKLYAVPKTHKPGMPYRPIISNINSVTYPAAKHAVSKLSYLNKYTKYTVDNSVQLVEKLKEVRLTENDILVSFDVKSLFTNVPPSEAIASLEESIQEFPQGDLTGIEIADLISITEFCAKQSFFKFKGKVFQQTGGLSMGSPLSPLLANNFMNKIEQKIFESNIDLPNFWVRYVDDILAVWSHGKEKLRIFLEHINKIHPKIQFTVEIEENGCIPFLDVLIKRKPDQTISTQVYRKKGYVCTSPTVTSAHPWCQKLAVFKTFVYRAYQVCSEPAALQAELGYIRQIATEKGFNGNIVNRLAQKVRNSLDIKETTTLKSQKQLRNPIILPYIPGLTNKVGSELRKYNMFPIYKPINKLNSIFSNYKDKEPPSNTSGIYKITCSDCDDVYIGQTRRGFKFRCIEHKRASGLIHKRVVPSKVRPEKSAVAAHVQDTGHGIGWDEAGIIKKCPNALLDAYEKLYIYKHQNRTMNRKDDNTFPRIWRDLVSTAPNPPPSFPT